MFPFSACNATKTKKLSDLNLNRQDRHAVKLRVYDCP